MGECTAWMQYTARTEKELVVDMEKRQVMGYTTYYTEGSAVRKQYVEPDYEIPEQEEPRREYGLPSYAKVRKAKEQKGLRFSMHPVFAVFLGAAVVATLLACCKVLSMQSEVTNQSDTITILQAQVEALEEDNNAYETRIQNSVNLDEIRDIAINQLGMVYPTEGQVVYYDLTESDYVRQYQDVPSIN